jgi:hypothetical protein
MRVVVSLLSVMLLGAAACAEQPGPPDPPDFGASEGENAALLAEEVSGVNAEAEGALRLSRLVLDKLDAADVQDPQKAVDRVVAGMGGGAACGVSVETRPNDRGAVYVTFDGCRDVFDAQRLSGTLRFFFGKTPGLPGLRVNVGAVEGSSLTVDGVLIPRYSIDATLSFREATTVLAWQVDWARQGRGGPDLSLRARFRTVVERARPQCSTTSGRASFEAGERGVSFDVDGYAICAGPLACPSGGAWSVTGGASRAVTFRFTGENAEPGPGGAPRTIVQVVGSDGRESELSVRCGARAGGG